MKETLKEKDFMHPNDLKPAEYLKEPEKHEVEKAPLVELKGFNKEKGSVLDYEQMQVFLKDLDDRLGNSGLKKFLENYCQISLNTTESQDYQKENAVRLRNMGGKLDIELNPLSFVEYGHTTYENENGEKVQLKYFNPAKAAFLLGRVIGSLVSEPDNWDKIKNKIDFVKNSDANEWEDFVGLCIVSPEEAKKISAHGYEHFTKILNKTAIDASTIEIDKKWKSPEFSFEKEIGQEKKEKGLLGYIKRNSWLNNKLLSSSPDKLKKSLSVLDKLKLSFSLLKEELWTKSSWYEITVAEFEDKEAGRILVQNIGIGDRDKSMRYLARSETSTDVFRLRTLLIADMKSGDYGRWRIHAYLQTCDSKYRETQGKQINSESYNFLMRLHRLSYGAKRFGTEVMEYSEVELGKEYKDENGKDRTATSTIYIRKNENALMDEAVERISTISTRNMTNGLDKEIFEYMKIDDRFIGIDEKYTREDDVGTTGKMSNLVGKSFYNDGLLRNMDNGTGCQKLNPDQIAVLARYYADEEASKNRNIYGEGEKGILNEYTPSIARAAFNNYQVAFSKPPYRKYVEYFLNQKKSELLNGGMQKDELEDAAKITNFKDKELKESKDKETFGSAVESSANISRGDINTRENSKQKIVESYNTLKNGEKILSEKGIGSKISKSQLNNSIKGYLNNILEESYNKGELFIQENVFEQFEKNKIDLTIEDKRAIQSILLETRPFRREIIRLRNSAKKLGIEPYLEKIREASDYTDESRKLHNMFKDKLEIIGNSAELALPEKDTINNIVESIKNTSELQPYFTTNELDASKIKSTADLIKLISKADNNLPRKTDLIKEKKKILELQRECFSFNNAKIDERDAEFDNKPNSRKERLVAISLIPSKISSDAINNAEALDILKKVEIAIMINESKPEQKKPQNPPTAENKNNENKSQPDEE